MQDLSPNSVLPAMANSLITMLVVSFLFNDVPHAAGLYGEDVETVARSRWARNLAKGQLRTAGIGPEDPNYETYMETYARRVAAGFLEV